MAISNKTRKILWGRSANRCAICRQELVIEATPYDDESVVGEECHIVSAQMHGPRYDSAVLTQSLDSYPNLMLLCCVHHKMVDDQFETYTVDILERIKANHEKWVAEKLNGTSDQQKPIRVRRLKKNIPTHLVRLVTGKDVLQIVSDTYGFAFDHDELLNHQEVELVGGFLQTAQDWGDLASGLEAGERVRIAFTLNETLKELEKAGFFVFGAREMQLIEGGEGPSADWPVAILRVVRKTNEEIITVSSSAAAQENAHETEPPTGAD